MVDAETKQQALDLFHERASRNSHPEGRFDKAGRWYPSEDEEQVCCSSIRRPSRAWPYFLMAHCRSLRHVINLVESRKETK